MATGYSVSKKTYDQQGRADKVFEPGIGNASSLVSTVTYDSLGRPSQTLLANGGVTKVDVEGYTTTHTDALLKTKSTTSNYLGQTITSTDHLGSVLSFSYNAFGDLLTASFAGVTRVSNQYDPYGRKISMSDIDKGYWLYSTNGFGELISQTNAKGENSRLSYNNAGQLTRRSDGAGTVCWTYGETAASYNVNQLTQVNQWTTDVACTSPTTPVYTETYSYNSKALVQSKTITIGGQNYVSSSSYDNFGRPDIQTFPSAAGITGPAIRTEYSNGVAYKQTDTSTGVVYQEALEFTARGQSSQVAYGNGVRATFSYDEATGWLEGNTVTKGGTTLQSYWYDFDDVGNVVNRQLGFGVGSRANLTETFKYDDLHRLKSRTVDSALNLSGALAMSQSFSYDKMGNIENKPGVGLYNFSYDANGNITHDGKRTFAYTAFEKPYRITQGSDTTDFVYGPNRELLQRIDQRGPHLTRSLMLDGYEQVSLPDGVVEHKYSVGDAIITKRSNSSSDVFYLHKDQQGSTSSITNASGNLVQQLMYDPWGKQQVVNTSLLTYSSPATSKGYTGHEMVNDFEVIHMGGRTYNPTLGRFMQADPFIQAPGNLQNYNRYSYVLNNPMSMTDPSGYNFLEKALRPFKNVMRSVFKAIGSTASQWLVNIGSMFCGPAYAACVATGNYDISRAFGASKTGALRGAAVAGVTAYVNGPTSGINVVQMAAEIIDSDLGRVVRFLQNGINIDSYKTSIANGLGETASYAYYETKNYYVSKEMTRFANKNGMSLAELNALLTVGSFAGNAIAGSRYRGERAGRNGNYEFIDGIGQRPGGLDLYYYNYDFAGLPFDMIDIALGYQGLLSASASEYVRNGDKNKLLVGYSLGSLDASNLAARGHARNALSISLPFGNVGMAGRTVNGTTDLVNGGVLGFYFTSGARWENKSVIDHMNYNYSAFMGL